MNKIIKGILIIIPIVLSGFLALNINKYNNTTKENKTINKKIINKQEDVINSTNKKEELETKINELKEEKKDKINEYERWLKWEEEIKSKVN